MGDFLTGLASRLSQRNWEAVSAASFGQAVGSGSDRVSAAALYPRWERFFRDDDIIVAETGTVSMGLGFARLPAGATFHNQTLWGSIGWATPAALGMAIAAPERRLILITGDGAHQFTAQEISQFGRLGLRPIIFVLNNDGYLTDQALGKDPAIAYNEITRWNYSLLPSAFGCEHWIVSRATTCGELDTALQQAENVDTGVYIEVVTDAHAGSPLAMKLHGALLSKP
jgi:indolepyruvate decarboxylase